MAFLSLCSNKESVQVVSREAEVGGSKNLADRRQSSNITPPATSVARQSDASLSGGCGVRPEDVTLKVTVFGAGRMGCAIAGQLSLKGASVTLYDHTEFTRNRSIQVRTSRPSRTVSLKVLDRYPTFYILRGGMLNL
jgi:hypothetical protein